MKETRGPGRLKDGLGSSLWQQVEEFHILAETAPFGLRNRKTILNYIYLAVMLFFHVRFLE